MDFGPTPGPTPHQDDHLQVWFLTCVMVAPPAHLYSEGIPSFLRFFRGSQSGRAAEEPLSIHSLSIEGIRPPAGKPRDGSLVPEGSSSSSEGPLVYEPSAALQGRQAEAQLHIQASLLRAWNEMSSFKTH
ncbi:unnamed protein product [Merluccius merluccius]